MTRPSRTDQRPDRGEVWLIRLDPIEGAEIDKTRPAVVVNPAGIGRLPLRIVVPVTRWKEEFATIMWFVHLRKTAKNGLDYESAADCFQVRSVSVTRFITKLGVVGAEEIEEISAAITLCVGG